MNQSQIKAYKNGNAEEVLKLEKNFRIKLPEDDKIFLIQYNGGDVTDGCLYVKELDEVNPQKIDSQFSDEE